MELTRANLNALRVGFKATFQDALKSTTSLWNRFATEVASENYKETYGWLKEIPDVREWIGNRVAHAL